MMVFKLKSICNRFSHYLLTLPKRFLRFLLYPFKPLYNVFQFQYFLLEWFLLFLDLLGFPEIIESIFELINWKLRGLTKEEETLVRKYFGNSINTKRIRINSNDNLISKQLNIAFVSFYTIHFYKGISLPTFIHEIVHIWQYEKVGSPYIIRCLLAQRTAEGYDYGGINHLRNLGNEKSLFDFNYEQMADIIKDGFILENSKPKFSQSTNFYSHYLGELKN